jgi:hypothetical protein
MLEVMRKPILTGSLLSLALGWNIACGSSGAGQVGGQAGTGAGGAGGAAGGESCSPDPLRTSLTVQQTGVSADAYDCQILRYSARASEPDAMIFKAIIYVESRFDYTAVGCHNTCGCPFGWTEAECGCCGLMQSLAPACPEDEGDITWLPDGHPDVTTAPSSPDWSGSVFNPDVNIRRGIEHIASNRAAVQQQFPGCSEEQYTLMAIGNFNHYGSARSCTVYNTDYADAVLAAYHTYSAAAGYQEHPYP